jgi:hypothetical protein
MLAQNLNRRTNVAMEHNYHIGETNFLIHLVMYRYGKV